MTNVRLTFGVPKSICESCLKWGKTINLGLVVKQRYILQGSATFTLQVVTFVHNECPKARVVMGLGNLPVMEAMIVSCDVEACVG